MRVRLSAIYCSVKDKVGYGTIKRFLNGQGRLKPGDADSGAGAEARAEGGKTHAAAKICGGRKRQRKKNKCGGKCLRGRAGAEAPAEGRKKNAAANVRGGGRRKRRRKEETRMRKCSRGRAAEAPAEGGKTKAAAKFLVGRAEAEAEAPAERGKTHAAANVRVGGQRRKRQRKDGK